MGTMFEGLTAGKRARREIEKLRSEIAAMRQDAQLAKEQQTVLNETLKTRIGDLGGKLAQVEQCVVTVEVTICDTKEVLAQLGDRLGALDDVATELRVVEQGRIADHVTISRIERQLRLQYDELITTASALIKRIEEPSSERRRS